MFFKTSIEILDKNQQNKWSWDKTATTLTSDNSLFPLSVNPAFKKTVDNPSRLSVCFISTKIKTPSTFYRYFNLMQKILIFLKNIVRYVECWMHSCNLVCLYFISKYTITNRKKNHVIFFKKWAYKTYFIDFFKSVFYQNMFRWNECI